MSLFNFDNSFTRLPSTFYHSIPPEPVPSPRLVLFNDTLFHELGGQIDSPEWSQRAEILGGNQLAQGSHSIAMAYAGHQFGYFVPQLGDGRAHLLGEHLTPLNQRWDIQLKGSGRTPYSRQGDGRSALGPALREFLISEALYYLGIPTTRTLAVVQTGESVQRDSLQPGGISTRVAQSHIRIGTFEYFARKNDLQSLKILADYTLRRHFSEVAIKEDPSTFPMDSNSNHSHSNPYLFLLQAICQKQAELVSSWMQVGFIHGVMNTDNSLVCGQTIDFGPCAFMDTYDPNTVFSSIDRQGRYAYAQQPLIIQWNLARLAETFIPLVDSDKNRSLNLLRPIIETFPELYEKIWRKKWAQKFGFPEERISYHSLFSEFQELLYRSKADYTRSFYLLKKSLLNSEALRELEIIFLDEQKTFEQWYSAWMKALSESGIKREKAEQVMHLRNPRLIARNHRVEEAIDAAVSSGKWEPLQKLSEALRSPFSEDPTLEPYAHPPQTPNPHYQTFCGT